MKTLPGDSKIAKTNTKSTKYMLNKSGGVFFPGKKAPAAAATQTHRAGMVVSEVYMFQKHVHLFKTFKYEYEHIPCMDIY